MNVQFRELPEPASSADARPRLPIATFIPRARPKPNCIRISPSAGTSISKPTMRILSRDDGRPPYPKAQPNARAAMPIRRRRPAGWSLSFMQQQHLDPNHVCSACSIRSPPGQGIRNHELAAAICSAINDWQIEKWTSKDCRLKGSIVVATRMARRPPPKSASAGTQEFRPGAAVEPHRRAAGPAPLTGRFTRRPKRSGFRSACMPSLGGNPITASGWPSFYIGGKWWVIPMPAGGAGEHRAGRRVRRHPKLKMIMIEPVSAGAITVLAARQELQRLKSEVAQCEAAAVGIYPRPHLFYYAAVRTLSRRVICST